MQQSHTLVQRQQLMAPPKLKVGNAHTRLVWLQCARTVAVRARAKDTGFRFKHGGGILWIILMHECIMACVLCVECV